MRCFVHKVILKSTMEQMSIYKLVIIGNADTGKTSLINRYVDNRFSNRVQSTIGIEFTHKELEDVTHLYIWDTAGQERFRSITASLYRGADAMMFVYDVTSDESFTALEHWWREYLTYGERDCIKVLVGNKIDLGETVSSERAKAFAVQKGMVYATASAKSSAGVHEAFATVVSQLNNLPKVQKDKIEFRNKPKSDRCCY